MGSLDDLPDVGAGAPNPAKCRAKNIHNPSAAECLVEPAPSCQFGFWFGGNYFCAHPDRKRIIARTRAAKRATGK